MGKISITIGTLLVIIVLVLSGLGTYRWVYNRDYSTLYQDGKIIARSRWYVDMQRFYFNIKYDYQRDNCLRDGGTISESGTRCYLPDETFYRLTRKLLSIELNTQNFTNEYVVTRKTSFNKYGTSGVTAGTLYENIIHNKIVDNIEEFPESYDVSYIPRDSSYYKLVWKVDKLKDINLPDGKYTDCNYQFGNMKINLENECDKLDYVLVENDKDRVWIYFKKAKDTQNLKVDLTDPNTLLVDLRSYWSLDTNADSDYGTNDGSVSGATHFDSDGINDGYYYFDGINDYIQFGSFFPQYYLTEFTVSLWYKANNTESGCTSHLNEGAGIDPVNPGMIIGGSGSMFRIFVCNNETGAYAYLSDDYTDLHREFNMDSLYTWHHLVITYLKDGSVHYWRVYINGVGGMMGTNNPLYLSKNTIGSHFGRQQAVYDNSYNGSIDEVGMWDRALSLSEIQELYNNGTGLSYGEFADEEGPVINLQIPINHYNTTSNSGNSNFTYNVTDLNTIIKCDLWINNGTWYINDTDVSITKSINQTFNKTLEEGVFSWKVGCEDQYNHYTNSTARIITVDYSAPIVNLQSPTNNTKIYNTYDVDFIFNTTDAGMQVKNCTLWLDHVANATDTSITETINQSFNVTNIPSGKHNWTVECYDTFNYSGNSSMRNFVIDYPPIIENQAPNNDTTIYDDKTVEFIFNVSDFDEDIDNCTLWLDIDNSGWQANKTIKEIWEQDTDFVIDLGPTGITYPSDITTNGSDFWVVDILDYWIYHLNALGDNQSDGFSVTPGSYALTTNGSDFWIANSKNYVAHYNADGVNQTDSFVIPNACEGTNWVEGITTNGSDFWMECNDDSINHTDASGTDLGDGFSTLGAGADDIAGIDTNTLAKEFWFIDETDKFIYHTDSSGNNFTDGFDISSINNNPKGITISTHLNQSKPYELWWTDITGTSTLYKGFRTPIEGRNKTIDVTFSNDDTNINWLITCYDNSSYAYNGTQRYVQLRDRPSVSLTSPANESSTVVHAGLTQPFIYSVSDFSDVENCSLLTSPDLSTWYTNVTDESITQDIEQSLGLVISGDISFYWRVGCYDNRSIQGNSSIRYVTYTINDPPVINLQAPDNVTITTNRNVNFIFNVSDSDSDIVNCSLWLDINDIGWVRNDTMTTGNGTHNSSTKDDYCVGNWWFEQNVIDMSGNGNIGTVGGDVTNISGRIDFAFHFLGDGGDKITIPTSSSLSLHEPNLTILAWVYLDSDVSGEHGIVRRDNSWALEIFPSENKIRNLVRTNGIDGWTATHDVSYTINANTWYLFGMTYDGSKLYSFANGVKVGTVTVTGNITNTNQPTYIPFHNIPGVIDEVLIFNRSLTSGEISAIYNSSNIINMTLGNNLTFSTTFEYNKSVDWKVSCNDDLTDLNSTTRNIILDNGNPEITIVLPANNTNSSTTSINFTYIPSDTLSDVTNCSLWINNGTWYINSTDINIEESVNQTFNLTIPDSNILWKIGCYDNASNSFNSSAYNLTSDGTAPVISFVSPTKNNGTYFNQTSIPVNVTITDSFFHNITFRLYDSNDDVINFTSYNSLLTLDSRYINYTGLSDDVYYYDVEACDVSGNCANSTRYINLDALYPVIVYGDNALEDGSLNLETSIYVDVVVTEISFKNITYIMMNTTNDVNSTTYTSEIYNINYTGQDDYSWHYFNVTVCDHLHRCTSTPTRRVKYIEEYTIKIELSTGITDILFYPPNMTAIVEPEDQTSVLGIITVTNDNITEVDVFMKLNETRDDITLYANEEYSISTWQAVNKSFFTLLDNISIGSENYIWLWAYYEGTTRKWVFPELDVRAGAN